LDDAAKSVSRVCDVSRARCRNTFERRFAASRMASDYIEIYKRLIETDMRKSRNGMLTSVPSLISIDEANQTTRATDATLTV